MQPLTGGFSLFKRHGEQFLELRGSGVEFGIVGFEGDFLELYFGDVSVLGFDFLLENFDGSLEVDCFVG